MEDKAAVMNKAALKTIVSVSFSTGVTIGIVLTVAVVFAFKDSI